MIEIPPVFPIIVYHGNTPWNLNNSISDIFEVIKGAEDFLPRQRNIVVDLGVFPDDKLNDIPEVNAFILALKYSRNARLFEKLPSLINQFYGIDLQRQQYLKVVIEYLYNSVSEDKRVEFAFNVELLLKKGDLNMKKFSSIWEELGYIVGEDDQKKRDNDVLEHKDKIIKKKDDAIKKKDDVIQKKDESIVHNLLKRNFTTEEISSITGLSIGRILEIIKKTRG